jgi:hypothetical protein
LTDPIPCVPIICGTSYSNKEAHKYMTKLRATLFKEGMMMNPWLLKMFMETSLALF